MVATRLQKRVAVDKSNPLKEPGILHRVLGCVGPGHWLFIALVNSEWKLWYESLDTCKVDGIDEEGQFVKLKCDLRTTLASAAFGSASRAQLAHECGLKLAEGTFPLQYVAGRTGDREALTVLRELHLPFTAAVACGVAATGQLNLMRWLHTAQSCPLTSDVADCAAGSGSIELLDYLKSEHCAFSEDTAYNAAGLGQIAVLDYLQKEGCPWDVDVTAVAARGRHIAALKWLREHGCPFEMDTIAYDAAEGGSIQVLQYLVGQGAALDVEANGAQLWLAAALGGSIEILNYLVQRGLEPDEHTLTAMLNVAGASEQLAAAQWCRQRGAKWPPWLMFDVPWEGATLAWVRAEGCTASTSYDDDDIVGHDDDLE
jgi:hypothetical protein